MTRTSLTRVISLLCITAFAGLAGVACGPNTNGNNGGGELTAAEFQAEVEAAFASSLCDATYDCPEEQNPQLTLFASRYGDKATCNDNILSLFGADLGSAFVGPVEAGLAEFNADKAQECLDAINAQSQSACYNIAAMDGSPDPSCEQILTGLQDVGDACDSDDHCASGDCDQSVDTGGACYGGECAEGTPAEPVIQSAGDSCSESNEFCGEGLTCDTNESNDFVCIEVDSRAEDGDCSTAAVCESGLACLDGVCTALTLGAEGDSCDLQETFCEPGLVCSFSIVQGAPTGSCTPPKEEGEECFQDLSCAGGLQCDGADFGSGTAGSCQPTLGEGEACESDIDCQSGLECGQDDTCQTPESQSCEIPTGDGEMSGS